MSENLEFTGERFTPECVREIWYEHFHRYAFAARLVQGLNVLDAACGEGYGSALLARQAASVTGVDLSVDAIEHARKRYGAGNIEFRAADCLALPFGDDEFDCVVSFETLEHLEDHEGLLTEFRRVLKPGGFLLVSTPDKAVYTDQMQTANEFHVRELYRNEFEELLSSHFPAWRLWGQKLLFQSAIWSLDPIPGVNVQQECDGDVLDLTGPSHPPVYLIAICALEEANLPLQNEGLSLFDDEAESVYAHYYHEIRKNMSAGGKLERLNREVEQLKSALADERQNRSWWRRLFGSG